jgi:hypothetical protein
MYLYVHHYFSWGLILFCILSLIFMYGICKIIQTYRDKVIVSRGIANQHVRTTTICRRVSLPPPHLDFYVTQHLKSSVNVETSLKVCCDSHVLRHCSSFILSTRAHDFRSIEQDLPLALSFSLDYLIQEMRMQIDAWSSFINISWFLMILGRRIGIHCRCKLVFLLDYLCPITVWWRAVLVC